jgi:hypothetical protein
MVMRVAFRMEDTLTEDARFGRRHWSFPIVVLIRHQHMFDVGVVVQHIHGGVTLPQEKFDGKTHREFDHVAEGMAMQEKAEGVTPKFGETSPPARDRWTGHGGRWDHLINHAALASLRKDTVSSVVTVNEFQTKPRLSFSSLYESWTVQPVIVRRTG